MVIESICAFGLVGFACEIGQRFTANFDEISAALDALKWYKFPMEIQRIWSIIIHVAQQVIRHIRWNVIQLQIVELTIFFSTGSIYRMLWKCEMCTVGI